MFIYNICKSISNYFKPIDTSVSLEKLDTKSLKKLAYSLGKKNSGSKRKIINRIVDDKKDYNGYIYIVENPNSKMLKIGRTKSRESFQLVCEYLYKRYRTSYGPKVRFIIYKSNNMYNDENTIHNNLKSHRIENSELFSCSVIKAKDICKKITNNSEQCYNKF